MDRDDPWGDPLVDSIGLRAAAGSIAIAVVVIAAIVRLASWRLALLIAAGAAVLVAIPIAIGRRERSRIRDLSPPAGRRRQSQTRSAD